MHPGIDIYSLILISIGLAMDAFSVAIVTGFGVGNIKISEATKISFSFGVAHVVMPIAGWLLGSTIVNLISEYDHWLAFILLVFVGIKMVREAFEKEKEVDPKTILNFFTLILFTVAVSIDALAVGLSFSLQHFTIWIPSLFMGISTLIFTFIGLMAGNRVGQSIGRKTQIIGGLVLIGIGVRIVLTHIA